MFGLFKKKNKDVDKKIIQDLAQCASDFEHDMRNIDNELAEFMSRALNLYIESRVGHMLFVPDIFALKRMDGIEEISRYSDFDR